MHYIVGLGNPGDQYKRTRHNVGFILLERFVADAGLPALHESSAYSGRVSEGVFAENEVLVLLPSTYMNASGSAVQKAVHKDDAKRMVVVYDDVDLPVGQMKISYDRGDGGHNGVKSIVQSLGTKEFARIRVGIAHTSFWTQKPVRPKGEKLAAYVLKPFSAKEMQEIEKMQETFNAALQVFVQKDAQTAMNQFN